MSTLRNNQRGFSAVEGLLVLIIIGLVGFVGWYVNHTKSTNSDITPRSSKSIVTDPAATWNSYSSEHGKFFVKYPATWSKASEGCTEGTILLGADSKSVGKCASEDFGQMSIISTDGDNTASEDLKDGYSNIVKQAITVSGVAGTKETGTASGQANIMFGGGALPDGTKVVKYAFYTQGKTYTATYTQLKDYPDTLSAFNLMVTKTLKFQP